MKVKHKAWTLLCLLLLSAQSIAHPGHDHEHWSSDLLHGLFYGAAALAFAAVSWGAWTKWKKNDKERSK